MPSIAQADRSAGMMRTIDLGAVTASMHTQYTPYTSPIAEINTAFGFCNYIAVLNNSLTVDLTITPDYNVDRMLFCPAGTITKLDNVVFRSFDLKNTGTGTESAGKIYLQVGWIPPLGSSVSLSGLK